MVVLLFRATFEKLEKWTDRRNPIKFNKGKCQLLHLRRSNHRYAGTNWLESSLAEKDLGILVVNKHSLAAKRASSLLGSRRQSVLGRLREGTFLSTQY